MLICCTVTAGSPQSTTAEGREKHSLTLCSPFHSINPLSQALEKHTLPLSHTYSMNPKRNVFVFTSLHPQQRHSVTTCLRGTTKDKHTHLFFTPLHLFTGEVTHTSIFFCPSVCVSCNGSMRCVFGFNTCCSRRRPGCCFTPLCQVTLF